LEYLDKEIQQYGGRLSVYQGNPTDVVKKLLETEQISAIYANRSYSPYGKKRDKMIEELAV
jgi:deoxyribodipyrimidine photo-lyase